MYPIIVGLGVEEHVAVGEVIGEEEETFEVDLEQTVGALVEDGADFSIEEILLAVALYSFNILIVMVW